jgi:hypothetical protein
MRRALLYAQADKNPDAKIGGALIARLSSTREVPHEDRPWIADNLSL